MIHYTVLCKIFIFAVLEQWLIYDCETKCSFVYLIFAVLLHNFFDLYTFMNTFEDNSFNLSRDIEGGAQNSKSR